MLRPALGAAVVLMLAATPSVADALTASGTPPTRALSERDRCDGVRPLPPPLCDDRRICDWTRPFRFAGSLSF